MGQKLNRHPTKEDMQMANKPVNRCPHRMSSGKSTLNYNEIRPPEWPQPRPPTAANAGAGAINALDSHTSPSLWKTV